MPPPCRQARRCALIRPGLPSPRVRMGARILRQSMNPFWWWIRRAMPSSRRQRMRRFRIVYVASSVRGRLPTSLPPLPGRITLPIRQLLLVLPPRRIFRISRCIWCCPWRASKPHYRCCAACLLRRRLPWRCCWWRSPGCSHSRSLLQCAPLAELPNGSQRGIYVSAWGLMVNMRWPGWP